MIPPAKRSGDRRAAAAAPSAGRRQTASRRPSTRRSPPPPPRPRRQDHRHARPPSRPTAPAAANRRDEDGGGRKSAKPTREPRPRQPRRPARRRTRPWCRSAPFPLAIWRRRPPRTARRARQAHPRRHQAGRLGALSRLPHRLRLARRGRRLLRQAEGRRVELLRSAMRRRLSRSAPASWAAPGRRCGGGSALLRRGAAVGLHPLQAQHRARRPGARPVGRAARAASGRADAPILVDQEGGRVQRFGAAALARAAAGRRHRRSRRRDRGRRREAAWLGGRLIAARPASVGVTVDCAPVADLPAPGAHDVIGDRAFGARAGLVARLGRADGRGAARRRRSADRQAHPRPWPRAGGQSPRAAQGRAPTGGRCARGDFAPFSALADLPAAMTAHVVYTAIDPERRRPPRAAVIERIVRGEIGFDGLLMSDDLSMAALERRAWRACRAPPRRRLRHRPALQRRSWPRWRAVVEAAGRSRRAAPPSGQPPRLGRPARPATLRAPRSGRAPPRPAAWRTARRMSEAFAWPPRPSPRRTRAEHGEALIVDLDGFEGPLDLLLALARRQKVDLLRDLGDARWPISISPSCAPRAVAALTARRRLSGDGGLADAAQIAPAAAGAARGHGAPGRRPSRGAAPRLPARQAARRCARPRRRSSAGRRLGREVFGRGDPDAGARHAGPTVGRRPPWPRAAYAAQRRRVAEARYRPRRSRAYPLEAARDRLARPAARARALDVAGPGGVRAEDDEAVKAFAARPRVPLGLHIVRRARAGARRRARHAPAAGVR